MNLFEDESVNITRIFLVDRFVTTAEDPETTEYNAHLNTYELIFFLEGQNRTQVDGVVIDDLPGTIRYMPKGKTRGPYLVTRISPMTCIDIFFDTEDPMPERACSVRNVMALKDRFVKIYHIFQSKRPGYYVQAMQAMYEIIGAIKKNNEGYLGAEMRRQMQKAYDYILENYRNPKFDYHALCAVTGWKYSYFSELFRKTYHMSPIRLVGEMRMDRARELLITGRYSVGETATMCGFENVYYFSSAFRKKTGFSPTGYLAWLAGKK